MCGVQTSSNLPAVIGFKRWLIAHKGNPNSEPAICWLGRSRTVKGTSRWAQGSSREAKHRLVGWQIQHTCSSPRATSSFGGNCASVSQVYKGALGTNYHFLSTLKKAPKQIQPFGFNECKATLVFHFEEQVNILFYSKNVRKLGRELS